MPITIVLPTPSNTFGPGLPFLFSSSAQFTPNPGDAFSWDAYVDTGKTQTIASGAQTITTTPEVSGWIGVSVPNSQATYTTSYNTVADNTSVTLEVNLLHAGDQVDTSTITALWNSTLGLGMMLSRVTTGQTAGFTATDRQTLNTVASEQQAQSTDITTITTNTNTQQQQWAQYETVTLPSLQTNLNNIISGLTATVGEGINAVGRTIGQIFSGPTLADLTEGDLGSACFPDSLVATAAIGGSAYGLQVQITQYPDWITFTGPGDNYTIQVLAVLVIQRGGNTILRHGIHTTTYMLYPMPGIPDAPIVLDVPVDPGDYAITIIPSAECCVSAQLLGFP